MLNEATHEYLVSSYLYLIYHVKRDQGWIIKANCMRGNSKWSKKINEDVSVTINCDLSTSQEYEMNHLTDS